MSGGRLHRHAAEVEGGEEMSENSNKEHLGVGIILGLFLGVASTLLLYHPAATKFSELSPGFHLTNGAQLIVVPNVTLHTKPNAYSFMFKDRVTVTMLGSVLLYEDFTVS